MLEGARENETGFFILIDLDLPKKIHFNRFLNTLQSLLDIKYVHFASHVYDNSMVARIFVHGNNFAITKQTRLQLKNLDRILYTKVSYGAKVTDDEKLIILGDLHVLNSDLDAQGFHQLVRPQIINLNQICLISYVQKLSL